MRAGSRRDATNERAFCDEIERRHGIGGGSPELATGVGAEPDLVDGQPLGLVRRGNPMWQDAPA